MASQTQTMKAWQITGPGALSTTLASTSHLPKPSALSLQQGEILVRVLSAGINPADYKIGEMGLISRAVISYPKTLGMDLSGEVVAAGPDVNNVVSGDYVMGRCDPLKQSGSLAEYVVLDKEAYAKIGKNVDKDEAAGAMTTALTAYQTIQPYVKAGDRIFINGGGGGTGTFGIQIGKLLGCHVTVSCSTAKMEKCKALGADEVIDYKSEDVISNAASLTNGSCAVIVDNVGNSPSDLYKRSHLILREGGSYVFVGGRVSGWTVANLVSSRVLPGFLGGQHRKFVAFLTKNVASDAQRIADWFGEGKLKTVLDSKYGFGEVPAAYERLKTDVCHGKVIVKVDEA